MALVKAVAAGAVAAVGVPYALSAKTGGLGDVVRANATRLPLGEGGIAWSWTTFAAVTLLAWGLLAWADR